MKSSEIAHFMLCRQKCSTSMRQTNPPPYFSPVIRMKCWLFTFLQARCKWIFLKWRDIFQNGYFWQNLGTFSSHANGNKTLYFWQHMRTFSSGVSGNKTRYFWRKVGMIFVCVCSNNVMRWDVWTFSSHVNDNKTAYFWQNTGTFSGHARGNNTGNVWWGAWQLPAVFLATEPGMPKHDLSPKPNKWVFVPKLTQTLSTALWKHRIENFTLNHKCSGNWVSMFFFLFTTPLCWLVVFIFS